MLEQLGLIGTIRDEDQSPDEPDTESEEEVSTVWTQSRGNQSPDLGGSEPVPFVFSLFG